MSNVNSFTPHRHHHPTAHSFEFVPLKQGKVKGKVKEKSQRDALELPPVTVLSGEFHPPHSTVKLEPSSCVAGATCAATITMRDKYKNLLSADDGEKVAALMKQITLTVKNGHATVKPEELKIKGNLLSTEFVPRQTGTVSLELAMKSVTNTAVTSNEAEVKSGPVDFEHCSIVLDAQASSVNTPVSLILTTKDQFSNITTGAKAENFVVKIYNEDEEMPVPRLMGKDKSSTAFAAQIIPTKVGRCYCEVTFYPPQSYLKDLAMLDPHAEPPEPTTRRSNDILITS